MDTIECIKNKYVTQSTGPIEYFIGCTMKHDLAKTTLKIYQTHIITRITQGFNDDLKLCMNLNTPDKMRKRVVLNQ